MHEESKRALITLEDKQIFNLKRRVRLRRDRHDFAGYFSFDSPVLTLPLTSFSDSCLCFVRLDPRATLPSSDRTLCICALHAETRCLRCLMARECHAPLLSHACVTELGHAAVAAGVERHM